MGTVNVFDWLRRDDWLAGGFLAGRLLGSVVTRLWFVCYGHCTALCVLW
jgi:hypothetical protein